MFELSFGQGEVQAFALPGLSDAIGYFQLELDGATSPAMCRQVSEQRACCCLHIGGQGQGDAISLAISAWWFAVVRCEV